MADEPVADGQWSAMRADWQRQDADFAEVHARLRRERWRPHVVLALELLGAALTLAVGIWYAWEAVKTRNLLLALSAGALFLSMPAFAIGTVLARRGSLRWEEGTPDGMLAVALRRAQSSLRAIGVGRWQVAMLVVFVAVLWVTQVLGFIDAKWFLVFYSAVAAATAIPYGLWIARRQRRLFAERAQCRKLIEELAAIRRAEETIEGK